MANWRLRPLSPRRQEDDGDSWQISLTHLSEHSVASAPGQISAQDDYVSRRLLEPLEACNRARNDVNVKATVLQRPHKQIRLLRIGLCNQYVWTHDNLQPFATGCELPSERRATYARNLSKSLEFLLLQLCKKALWVCQ